MNSSSVQDFLSLAAPFFQQIPSQLFSNVTEDMIYRFLDVTTFFWRQVFENQPIVLQSFEEFDQFANTIFVKIKPSPLLQVSQPDYSFFDSFDSSSVQSSSISPLINSQINQIYYKCNDSSYQNDYSLQLQKIDERINELNFIRNEIIYLYQNTFQYQPVGNISIQDLLASISNQLQFSNRTISSLYYNLCGDDFWQRSNPDFENLFQNSNFIAELNKIYYSVMFRERVFSEPWRNSLHEISSKLKSFSGSSDLDRDKMIRALEWYKPSNDLHSYPTGQIFGMLINIFQNLYQSVSEITSNILGKSINASSKDIWKTNFQSSDISNSINQIYKILSSKSFRSGASWKDKLQLILTQIKSIVEQLRNQNVIKFDENKSLNENIQILVEAIDNKTRNHQNQSDLTNFFFKY
jgi:hypothetical protein